MKMKSSIAENKKLSAKNLYLKFLFCSIRLDAGFRNILVTYQIYLLFSFNSLAENSIGTHRMYHCMNTPCFFNSSLNLTHVRFKKLNYKKSATEVITDNQIDFQR